MPKQNDASVAFDFLLDEIGNSIDEVNQRGAAALRRGSYDEARQLMDRGAQMTELRKRILKSKTEWEKLVLPAEKAGDENDPGRLQRGLRTPEDAFRVPILQALVETGGSGRVADVLDRVGAMMGDQLNDYDREPLPSTPSAIRWRNNAQWARNSMVGEGLLASDSPRGIWEITQKGREWLAENV